MLDATRSIGAVFRGAPAALLALALAGCDGAGRSSPPPAPARVTPAPPPAESPSAPPTASAPAEPPRVERFRVEDFNVVFIALTNLRADHLGCYGYERDTSPRIDRLARESLVFEDAYSHASWTLPVAISLFASQYPFTHGMMNRREAQPLPGEVETLVDVLNDSGRISGAFVGDRDYAARFGLTSRFHVVFDFVEERALEDWKRYGVLANTVPEALAWLRGNRERRFFMLLQGYDVHCPFASPVEDDRFDPGYDGEIDFSRCYWTFRPTPAIRIETVGGAQEEAFLLKTKPDEGEEFEELFTAKDIRHMEALYDGEIRRADDRVGEVLDELDALELSDRTIVVFLSEHGDMFGKHGRFMRGGPLRGTFYDDVLHVPLIIRHPGLAPRRVRGLAQLIDVAPTVLDMLGLESPDTFRGLSLRPLILEGKQVNEAVFAGSAYTPQDRNYFFRNDSIITSVRTSEWKLVHERLFYREGAEDVWELYDVASDPAELENLVDEHAAASASLRGSLRAWLESIAAHDVLRQLDATSAAPARAPAEPVRVEAR